MGLFGASIPLILTEKGASFRDLGELAIMGLPYVLKILFAPAVDSVSESLNPKRVYVSRLNQITMEKEKLFLFQLNLS